MTPETGKDTLSNQPISTENLAELLGIDLKSIQSHIQRKRIAPSRRMGDDQSWDPGAIFKVFCFFEICDEARVERGGKVLINSDYEQASSEVRNLLLGDNSRRFLESEEWKRVALGASRYGIDFQTTPYAARFIKEKN